MIGNSQLTAQLDIAYPFDDDSSGLATTPAHGPAAALHPAAVADAVVIVAEGVERVFLSTITYVDADTRNVAWVDEAGATLITLACTAAAPSANTFHVLHGQDTTTRTTLRIVVTAAWYAHMAAVADGVPDAFSYGLPLAAACVQADAQRVLTLDGINSSTIPDVAGPLFEDVTIEDGYNINLRAEEGAQGAIVHIDAVAGAGAGRVPCSELHVGTPPFAGLTPDADGNVVIVGAPDGCRDVVPDPVTGTIALHNACTACCTCERYAAQVEELRAMFARLAAAYATLEAARVAMNAAITAWNKYTDGAPDELVSGEVRVHVKGTSYNNVLPGSRRLFIDIMAWNVAYKPVEITVVLTMTAPQYTRMTMQVLGVVDKALDGTLGTRLVEDTVVAAYTGPATHSFTFTCEARSKTALFVLYPVVPVTPPALHPTATVSVSTTNLADGGTLLTNESFPWTDWT